MGEAIRGRATEKIIIKQLSELKELYIILELMFKMGEVNVGPTVTQFTLKPREGVKLSRIVALQNDLALSLAARSIRVEAPIPGRALVGIEVPNKTVSIVKLKEILSGSEFQSPEGDLKFALGKDVSGNNLVIDLADSLFINFN